MQFNLSDMASDIVALMLTLSVNGLLQLIINDIENLNINEIEYDTTILFDFQSN